MNMSSGACGNQRRGGQYSERRVRRAVAVRRRDRCASRTAGYSVYSVSLASLSATMNLITQPAHVACFFGAFNWAERVAWYPRAQ
jgi:hypothetical protein